MKRVIIGLLGMLTIGFISCRKKDIPDNISINGLGGDVWQKTALDKWLYDSITSPYNIEMKYKWDMTEFDFVFTLVPPREDVVIPVTQSVLRLWIDTYNKAAGTNMFMKQYAPKQVVLSGSPALNKDGSGVAGLAEGGLRILLFSMNTYNSKNRARVEEMAQLIHHEFTHILNQKKAYPPSFEKITADAYLPGSWNQVNATTDPPFRYGYVSNYGRSQPGEDIAEIVAWMLVWGKDGYEKRIADFLASRPAKNAGESDVDYNIRIGPILAKNKDGIAKLRQKEALIVQYFKDSYKLDLYYLQTLVQESIKELIK